MNKTAAGWAVVTGANGGLGAAFAMICAREGYNVLLAGRDAAALNELAQKIESAYAVQTRTFSGDLSHASVAQKLYDFAHHEKLEVEILVNNAGFGDYAAFVESDAHTRQQMIAVNVQAVTELLQLFGKDMVRRGQGRVLNIASMAAFLPGPYMATYHATKAYVLSLGQAVAEEWRGTGVTVTTLCPGPTKTNFSSAAHADNSQLFRGRLPSAESVAEYGFQAMMAGKAVAIPGLRNKLIALLTRLTPRTWQVRRYAQTQRPTK